MGYWWHALERRSQRGRLAAGRKQQLAARYIPLPVIPHPYPQVRFDAKHPSPKKRKPTEPYASAAPVRICAGLCQERVPRSAMLYQR